MNPTPPPPPPPSSSSSSSPAAPPPPPPPSDGHLVVAAGEQDAGAWDELVRRHEDGVAAVAEALGKAGRSKSVQQAIDALHDDVISSDTTGVDSGLRALRPRFVSKLTDSVFGPGETVDPSVSSVRLADDDGAAVELDDLDSLSRGFGTLPEIWQTALWHRVVERHPAAEYATLLGRAPNDVGSTVQRAEHGLFEAYLSDQRSSPSVGSDCAAVISLLEIGHRQELDAADQQLVDDHVDGVAGDDAEAASDGRSGASGCEACARRLAVGRELSPLLAAALVPGLTGLSVEEYQSAARTRPSGAALASRSRRRRRLVVAGAACAGLLAVGAVVSMTFDSRGASDTDPSTSADNATTTADVDPSTTAEQSTPTTQSAPTTTELLLRPEVTGPVNIVEVMFDEAQVSGFAPAPADLSVALSSPGPIFAGGTGTIDLAVTNAGDADVTTTAVLMVPSGIVFDALVDGPARCSDPTDDSARCTIDVSAGSTELVTIRFRLQSSNVGSLIVMSNLAEEDLDVPIAAVPYLLHSSVDEGQTIIAGNTLMTCLDTDPACTNARIGIGEVVNRWDVPAQFVGADFGPGWLNASSATVDLGGGGVEAAYLFWSGDLSERDVVIPNDGRVERVTFLPPGADQPVEIEAERVRLGDVDASQYFGSVDVTDLVKFYGPGEYTVGNVESAEVQGSYAGWAMVIITSDASLPRRSNVVLSPFAWFSPDDTYAIELDVFPQDSATASVGVLAFEGERGFVPERLQLGDVVLGESAFDSSIVGERNPSYNNNLGIDVDTYDVVIDAPNGTLPIMATSDNDGIRLAVLALAFDVE